jgi:transcriptional antiterminator RfaH
MLKYISQIQTGRNHLINGQPSWFAVYTKPRQERIALENLERQGFRCFLPMAINPYQRRSEKTPRIEPLFPRYLFLNAIPDQQSLSPVRSTRGVATLVRFGIKLAHVPETVIDMIQSRRDPENDLVRLDPVPAQPGDRVRVFDGPLAGLEGIFKERKGTKRALLLMSMLGTESTVEVDALMLQTVT